MKSIPICLLALMLILGNTSAQQPAQPQFQTRLNTIVNHREAPSARTNYQLELTVQRGGKTAQYKLTLNSGSVSTELIDRLSEKLDGTLPLTISFNATFQPFPGEEGGGGEFNLSLGRSFPYKTKLQVPGAPPGTEREATALKTIPFSTKVSLTSGQTVVIFEDVEEKISLKLTELQRLASKP